MTSAAGTPKEKGELITLGHCWAGWSLFYFAWAYSSVAILVLIDLAYYSWPIVVPSLLVVAGAYCNKRHPDQWGLNSLLTLLAFSLSWPMWVAAVYLVVIPFSG